MEMFLMYLWLKLDAVVDTFSALLGISICITIVYTIWYIVGRNTTTTAWDDWYNRKRHPGVYGTAGEEPTKYLSNGPYSKKGWIAIIVFGFLAVFIPSSKQTAYIVGVHYAVLAAESPEGQKIVSVMRKKANEFLDEQLKDTPAKSTGH